MRFLRSALLGTVLLSAAVVTPASAALPATPIAAVWTEPNAGYGFFYQAINSAHTSIDLSLYELKDPVAINDLVAAAHRGVNVTVILNQTYFGKSKNASAFALLQRHQVHVYWAVSGQIFHAKYLVVDSRQAYIGTGNLVPSDYGDTRDYWVEDTNRANVAAIVATFTQDVKGFSAAFAASPGLVWSPGSAGTLVAVIGSARHTLFIENEEMYSYTIENAIVTAAKNGVNVTVVMTRDSKYYSDLTFLAQNGVHVKLLGSSQLYIHAKAICADCSGSTGTAFVGSENFSTSSLNYNRELGVVTTNPAVVRALVTAITADAGLGTTFKG
jgi:phosphatidylserine/phosphatidylglycerophosphate/cardiolipin synthase-like enzyme